jgi:hypothetical protein
LNKRSGRPRLKACDAQNMGHNRPHAVGFPIRHNRPHAVGFPIRHNRPHAVGFPIREPVFNH